MGVYNCKNFDLLRASVKSICSQTFTDWELIICDDGSTNNSLEVLHDLEKLDNRIRIITYKRNRGLAYALNRCIEIARGKYIARQDDDDISLPSRLEKEVNFLEDNPNYSLVGCNASIFNDNGKWGIYKCPEKPSKKDFLWNSPFLHPSVMIKKQDLIDSDCYRVSIETSRCEDYDLFMRMYSLGLVGYNLQEVLYCYRIENGQVKHRPMLLRVQESIVRFKGFTKLHILFIGIPFIVKPILLGLIPQSLFRFINKAKYLNN